MGYFYCGVTMALYKLSSPIWLPKNKKGDKYYLNLNKYRNTHYQTLNKLKIAYKEYMKEQILALPYFDKPIKVAYVAYPPNLVKFDLGNYLVVHQKFFEDALVELKRIHDDNYLYIVENRQLFGKVDRLNPRVAIYIKQE